MHPKILNLRPAPFGAGGRAVAFVDVQLTPDCRLYNLKLVTSPEGYRIHAPSAFGAKTATFSATFAAELVSAAIQAIGDNPIDVHPGRDS